jgi:hypothetical protein
MQANGRYIYKEAVNVLKDIILVHNTDPNLLKRVGDPLFHVNVDLDADPYFYSNANANPDPTLYFDTDPAYYQSDANLRPLSYKPPALHFKPPGLHCECPRLHFEPLKMLNFDFDADADLDSDFYSNADPDPASRNNADSDPLPCFSQE